MTTSRVPSARPVDEEPLPEPAPFSSLPTELPKRLVIIGDVNGNDSCLARLLYGTGLIDEAGEWSGATSVLVQMGDVLNRGATSRRASDRLIRLRPQAEVQEGAVVWLLGNHEVMTALEHEAYVTSAEYMEFAQPEEVARFVDERTDYLFGLLGPSDEPKRVAPVEGRLRAWEEAHAPGQEELRTAFSAQGIYGGHIRTLPMTVKLGPLLLVHGGLSLKWAQHGLDALEEAARASWASASGPYQSLDPSGVFRDPSGPLWHRAYCVSESEATAEELRRTLSKTDVARMIVGHTRTDTVPGGVLGHPLLRQEGRIVMTDVGIGEPGEPGCALIVEEGQIDVWSPIDGRYPLCSLEP